MSQAISSLIIICLGYGAGGRQDIPFSRGSGTQTASRFSSTSCRGSSYFSCCWPWWRPSLGRPPVPACRTSTGTPPIQCKSALLPLLFSRLSAPHLFCVIIFYHTGHWDSRARTNSDGLEMPRSMLTLRAGSRTFNRQSLRGRIPGARVSSLFHPKNRWDGEAL